MAFDTTPVSGGNVGTIATVQVASDTIGGGKYQRVKQANPNADQTGAYGIDADPVRVRPRRRGTADYDSGIFTVDDADPIVPGVVTASTIYPESGVLINDSHQVREVRWTNSADAVLGVATLQPKQTIAMPVPASGSWAGLKMGADGDGVSAQIAGAQ